MTSRLFDASSIILLAKRHSEEASTVLEGQYRLDLTMYEVGNAIWKINKLINKADKLTAMEAVDQAYYLTALMEVAKIEEVEDIKGAMEIAFDGRLSFYDSAYLYSARKMGLSLVTEDERLGKWAREVGVSCIAIIDCL